MPQRLHAEMEGIMKHTETIPRIELSKEGVYIDGQAVVLLSASLFYFRLPRAEWRDRMRKVRDAGYHAIDVYFPWNFHEPKPGQWEFEEDKDAGAFLRMAAEEGLYVIARPGPYICSEWDGGALPAYLFTRSGMKLRDNDPQFLAETAKWYGRIMPILRRYEYGREGTVICVQLDNELDFYACEDPKGYMSALRDLARAEGIGVPLIACAGQGDLFRASGYAEGIVPTCNFYPDDVQPDFEEKVRAYQQRLSKLGYPLLVTETNRSHYLLRRLLVSGAKLLGPYLQVSGTDFGFTNAANNWGDPLAMLTTDYDFGGMISPEGHLRPEIHEGRMLGRLISTYGTGLASGTPDEATAQEIRTSGIKPGVLAGPHVIRFPQGGIVFALANLTGEEAEATVSFDTVSLRRTLPFRIGARECPFFPLGVPMETWGYSGVLEYANAELVWVTLDQTTSERYMIFQSDHHTEVCFRFERGSKAEVTSNGAEVDMMNDGSRLRFMHQDGSRIACLTYEDGRRLYVVVCTRDEALRLTGIGQGRLLLEDRIVWPQPAAAPVDIAWTALELSSDSPLFDQSTVLGRAPNHLEYYGIYRGFGWYEAVLAAPTGDGYCGLMLEEASDIVSVYVNGRYEGTHVPAGGMCYLPGNWTGQDPLALTVRAEIWGHTNFDDNRLPSIRLQSTKGIKGVTGVRRIRRLTDNWRFKAASVDALLSEAEKGDLAFAEGTSDASWTVIGWGAWMDTSVHARGWYRKTIGISEDADAAILHFRDLQCTVKVYINGREHGVINPRNPFLRLDTGERSLTIACEVNRHYASSAGEILLYEGTRAEEWTLTGGEEQAFWEHAMASMKEASAILLPYPLRSGGTSWLHAVVPDSNHGRGWRVRVDGKNLKLTVFFNGRVTGRLWTPDSTARPVFSGGDQTSFLLPGSWFAEGAENRLAIYAEAVARESDGILRLLEFFPVQS
ncbi:hypothetical protein BBD40_09480 [Paenibacillus ihbetae]|uniref:Glycoside hydrolase 35 catalytic domain-containing protein n=2 Tax=Paenibacillus ihbetae TaxID=1870820 RepID=A0ABX3JXH6_9BACL|nr:hypothetical protein BBD40_09480 [Paenibacillus ihbetae]